MTKSKGAFMAYAFFILFFLNSCQKDLQEQSLNLNETTSSASSIASTAIISDQKIEAEDFIKKSRVQTGTCGEGGLYVAPNSSGSWMDYNVNVNTSGSYQLSFRIAGQGGQFQLRSADGTTLSTVNVPSTGGSQNWLTITDTVNLSAGAQKIRIYSLSKGYNINWFTLGSSSSTTITPTPTPIPTSGNLLLESTFEDPATAYNNWTGKEVYTSWGLTSSNTIKRSGNYSARFEFRKTDVQPGAGYVILRSELARNDNSEQERWFGWSNYFPSSDLSDPAGEVVGQWHHDPVPGETWGNPPLLVNLQNDRFNVEVRWAATTAKLDGQKNFDLGPLTKDVWHDWVFHIKWSYQSDGILEAWKDGVQVISYFGPNCYNEPHYPYFKLGIYKWSWEDPNLMAQSPGDTRVAYYDEVRVGNKYSSFEEVSPR